MTSIKLAEYKALAGIEAMPASVLARVNYVGETA
jgi:hypothetical protein